MTHEWVETKRAEQRKFKNEFVRAYYQKIMSCKELTAIISEKDIKKSITRTIANVRMFRSAGFLASPYRYLYKIINRDYSMRDERERTYILFVVVELYEKIYKEFFDDYQKISAAFLTDYKRYEDSEPVNFDGNILITDPCYCLTDEAVDNAYYNPESIGIHGMMSDTLYGDWSCTTYREQPEKALKKIGEFCADAGMVGVFDYDDIIKHNPAYAERDHSWSATIIKNFKGTVQFCIEEITWVEEEDSLFAKKGEVCHDYKLHIKGTGINTKSKKPFNFITKQTGF